ncbi:MAG: DUF1499 domain-containing protein [Halioglobus sp.]
MNQAPTRSKLVTVTGVISLILLLALPVSVVLVRSGQWQPGLGLYALSCAGAVLVMILFIILLMLPGFKTQRAAIFKRALLVLPGTILLVTLVGGRGDYPPIHDISTDTLEPPTFSAAGAKRGEGANPLTIKPDSIAMQIQSYPGLTTLRNSNSLEDNFDRALATATALGWEIYHQDRKSGTIEAVDTTAIMNFKDDVVIRLRTQDSETLIDMRSVSRVGVGDIGANAKRIRAFQKQFNS